MRKTMKNKRMLVVAAHPSDVLWRCSGVIAKHVALEGTVDVIVLTYGTGGEANELMKAGMTIDEVKELRRNDLLRSAEILGVSQLEFWDLKDYRLEITQDVIDQKIRAMGTFELKKVWRPATWNAPDTAPSTPETLGEKTASMQKPIRQFIQRHRMGISYTNHPLFQLTH